MRLINIGDVFGKWIVIDGPFYMKPHGKDKRWHCLCRCFGESLVRDYDLKSGKSIGCRACGSTGPNSELGQRFIHIPKDIMRKVRAAAQNAIARCTDPTHQRYNDWGGRGIKIIFPNKDAFVEHLLSLPGYDNITLVIDRIDNDKHYEVGNLRWITRSESQKNQRDQGGEHGYYMKHDFARCFKRLHDKGVSFKDIGNLYCANPATVRNCVRELETGHAFGS